MMTDDKPRPGWRRLTEDERRLWAGITRSIVPLKGTLLLERAHPATTAPREERAPSPPRRRVESPPAPHPAAKPAPVLAPLDRRLKQRLARGNEPIGARLDLHGRTQSEAHGALLHFLRRAQAEGVKVALVITGKGPIGPDFANERGVLKRQVPFWLRLPEFRPYVLGVDGAHIGHGGEGALYVRVRRSRGSA